MLLLFFKYYFRTIYIITFENNFCIPAVPKFGVTCEKIFGSTQKGNSGIKKRIYTSAEISDNEVISWRDGVTSLQEIYYR